MEIWKTLFWWFGGGSSPRQALLEHIIRSLWSPTTPGLRGNGYHNMVSYFLWYALVLVVVHLFVAAWQGVKNRNPGQEFKSWLIGAFLVFGGVWILPAFFIACRAAFTIIAREIVAQFMGTDDPDKIIKILETLSGNTGIDGLLTIVQLVAMLILLLEIYLTFVAMFLSVVLTLVGVTMRWAGGFGENVYRFCLHTTFFGLAGNMIALLVLGAISGIGHATSADKMTLAFLNTGALIMACVVIYFFMKRVSSSLKGVVSSAASGLSNARDRLHGVTHGMRPRGGEKQTEEQASSHKSHGAKASEAGKKPAGNSGGRTRASQTGTGKPSGKSGTANASEQKPRSAWQRYSSTAARSVFGRSPSTKPGSGSAKPGGPTVGGDAGSPASQSAVQEWPNRRRGQKSSPTKGDGTARAGGPRSSGSGNTAAKPTGRQRVSDATSAVKTVKTATKVAAADNPVGASVVVAHHVGKKAKTRRDMKRKNATERRRS